jgi:hypothetical protein
MKDMWRFVGLALLGAVACGQGDEAGERPEQAARAASLRQPEPTAAPTSRADELNASACDAEEMFTVEACLSANCPGLSGPEFSACALTFCEEEIFDVSGVCQQCLFEHQNENLEQLVEACGSDQPPPPPPTHTCTAEELPPLEACANEHCEGLAGNELLTCAFQFCQQEVFATSVECRDCLSQNVDGGIEGAVEVCGPETTPEPSACSSGELDPLVLCGIVQCGKQRGPALINCALARCGDEVAAVSPACSSCMVSNADGAIPGVIEACGP